MTSGHNGHPAVTADDIVTELDATATPDTPAAQAAPDDGGTVSLRRLADVEPTRIEWLWPGYLAHGKIHLLDGDPKLGKSTLLLDLAARISTGAPWPDGHPGGHPADVVLLSAEDGLADTIRTRLDAAGADTTRVHAITGIRDTGDHDALERLPSIPRDLGRILTAIETIRPALIIIDPLMAYLGPSADAHRDQDVRRALAPLARLAETLQSAVVLVRHLTKAAGADPLRRGGGSIGIIGAARIALLLARDPTHTDRIILATSASNISTTPPSLACRVITDPDHDSARITWESHPVHYTAADLLDAASLTPGDRAERNDADTWLHDYLTDHDGTASYQDIQKAAAEHHIPARTLRRARHRIGATVTRQGYPARATWTLPTPPTP